MALMIYLGGPLRAHAICLLTLVAASCGTSRQSPPEPVGGDASTDTAIDGADAGLDAALQDADVGLNDAAADREEAEAPDAADASGVGCVDVRVTHSMLPDPGKWSAGEPPIGVSDDRDRIWRDANGVHVAWTALYAGGGGIPVVSSFDASNGALLGHRFFQTDPYNGFAAAGMSPDGTVAMALVYKASASAPTAHAIVLFRTDAAPDQKLVALPAWSDPNMILVGIGWDGEAFAVHGFASDNTQYVTRIKPDGTVLLAPTAFGVGSGYADEIRYVTDPVGGASYAVSGRMAYIPYLTGHLRDGTPIPDPNKLQHVQLQPQGWQAGWGGAIDWPTIRAVPGGAAVAWSGSAGSSIMTTFVQPIGNGLQATAGVTAIAGDPYPPNPPLPTVRESLEWLTVQPLAAGWWVAGTNTLAMIEYLADGSGTIIRREMVSFSEGGGVKFDVRYLESAKWNDEVWLGFQDNTPGSLSGEHPYRVVLVKPGCVYRSMMDELLGQ